MTHDPARLNTVAHAVTDVLGYTPLSKRYAIAELALDNLDAPVGVIKEPVRAAHESGLNLPASTDRFRRPVIITRGALNLPGFRNLTGGWVASDLGSHHEAWYVLNGFTVTDPRKREEPTWHKRP